MLARYQREYLFNIRFCASGQIGVRLIFDPDSHMSSLYLDNTNVGEHYSLRQGDKLALMKLPKGEGNPVCAAKC